MRLLLSIGISGLLNGSILSLLADHIDPVDTSTVFFLALGSGLSGGTLAIALILRRLGQF